MAHKHTLDCIVKKDGSLYCVHSGEGRGHTVKKRRKKPKHGKRKHSKHARKRHGHKKGRKRKSRRKHGKRKGHRKGGKKRGHKKIKKSGRKKAPVGLRGALRGSRSFHPPRLPVASWPDADGRPGSGRKQSRKPACT